MQRKRKPKLGHSLCSKYIETPWSPKFKRVSLKANSQFHFWGLNICVDLDLRDSE